MITTSLPPVLTSAPETTNASTTPASNATPANAEHEARQKSPKRRNHHETLIPGLPYNPGIEKYIAKSTAGFKTPSQNTAEIIKVELKKRWGKDLDPDNTFIVTLNYDPKKPKPTNGKVLNKISLTQAALHNVQRANHNDEHQTPAEKKRSTLHTWLDRLAPVLPVPAVVDQIDTVAHQPTTYEGIFVGAQPGQREVYNTTNLLPHQPAAFRNIVWNTEFSKPYTQFLNEFWPAHQHKYEQMSKASLVASALGQFENDSLNARDTDLVMRAAGLPSNTTWKNLKLDDLGPAATKDPDVQVGLLSINSFKSVSLLTITDKKTSFDTNGNPINRTLLYIPGNSSPIHGFDSPSQMKTWLAEQAADPVKREALSMHFSQRDQADRFFSEGVNQTLVGIGGWSKKDAPDASVLERLNEFDPEQFIKVEPLAGDPFIEMTQRQKKRSYDDAETEITTDGDVTKATILEVLETTTKIALMMTPLAAVMPEVAVGLEVFYLTAGAAEAGIGADDLKHGKPGGADHIVFGVLNAAPVIAGGASKLIKAEQGATHLVGDSIEASVKEPVVPDVETPEKPIVVEPPVNRLRPIQAANISQHAVPNGEQLIEGATRNSKGIYQVKAADGTDQWLIRYTDATGVPKVYEIKGDFKLSNDYVQIIDRSTRKPVMTVHSTLDGEWAREIGPGGARKWPWQRTPSPTPSNELKLPPKFSDQFVTVDGSKIQGAEPFDKYFNFDTKTDYVLSTTNYEEQGAIKQSLNVSWTQEEENFAVLAGEKATPYEGGSDYYDGFVKDSNRSNYSIRTTTPTGSTEHTLSSTGRSSAEEIQADKIKQFEQLIPDPELRARISEVAHQGSMGPAMEPFFAHKTASGEFENRLLTDNVLISNRDHVHFHIDYDPSKNVTHVTASGNYRLMHTEEGALDNINIQARRTFTIHHTPSAGSRYTIDKNAPTHFEISVKTP
ncbi:hypothetical protein CWC48_06085 [Pseudomonas sp. S10E 269]|uniref:dermonecrotic toxin domain-containing protein n=1 Tax=unclassified Pseudomonas TaxID=196821 RepID=UPI000C25AB34|nr:MULTISPECIES: DUF6543 domain-containing protein [unclassified Pseudomonas]PJK34782.1 hypothetical protein CWC49_16245 [Pseudomonas sp. S09F 262]PJK38724.1 hypothetical protein CWC48_06085 [Pseudomonas sp. S10E 269]